MALIGLFGIGMDTTHRDQNNGLLVKFTSYQDRIKTKLNAFGVEG